MSEDRTGEAVGTGQGRVEPAVAVRDRLGTGAAAIDAVLGGRVAPAAITALLTTFCDAAVAPTLAADPADRADLLAWGIAHGLPSAVEALLVELTTADSGRLPRDLPDAVEASLYELSIALDAPPTPPPAPIRLPEGLDEVVVRTAGGPAALVALSRERPGAPWSRVLPPDPAVRSLVEDAVAAWPNLAPVEAPDVVVVHHDPVPDDPALALPRAVAWLRTVADLPALPGIVVRGRSVPGGVEAPAPDDVAEASALVRSLGRSLVVPGSPGQWLVYDPTGGCSVQDAPTTLSGLAALLWPDRWAAWAADRHRDELGRADWHLAPATRRAAPPQPICDTDTKRVDDLVALCDQLTGRAPHAAVVVGGHHKSGRTAIVRCLAARLGVERKSTKRWTVAVLETERSTLPDTAELVRAGEHAFGAVERHGPRRLLVLDGFEPNPRSSTTVRPGERSVEDVDRVLPDVASRLDAVVVAVCLYDEQSLVDWKTSNIEVRTAVVGAPSLYKFVEDLGRRVDLAPERALRELGRERSADLRRLCQLMIPASAADEAAREPWSVLRDEYRAQPEETRDELARLAAVSLLGRDWGAAPFSDLTDEQTRVFGLLDGQRPGRVKLDGRDDAMEILTWYGGAGPSDERPTLALSRIARVAGDVLSPVIADLLDGDDPREATQTVLSYLHGARLFHPDLCRTLLEVLREDRVMDVWRRSAPVALLGRSLVDFLVAIDGDGAAEGLAHLVDRLPSEKPADLGLSELITVTSTLRRLLGLLDEPHHLTAIAWLTEATEQVLNPPRGTPQERYAMAKLVARFHEEDIDAKLAEHGVGIVADVARTAEDFRLVRRTERLLERVVRDLDDTAAPFAALYVGQEDAVRALLLRERDRNGCDIRLVVEMVLLRLRHGEHGIDWDTVVAEHRDDLSASLEVSGASALTSSLRELHAHRPEFATRFLNLLVRDEVDRVRRLLAAAAAADAASLLTTIASMHGAFARRLLDPSGLDAAVTMARRQHRSADAKGAGMLVPAMQRIDELYGDGGDGAARRYVETLSLRWVRHQLRTDIRSSVSVHLVRAVWQAGASYREDLLHLALNIVATTTRRAQRTWGPDLVLDLAQDRELASRLLPQLETLVPRSAMVAGMAATAPAEVQRAYHRLGRALFPAAVGDYLRDFDENAETHLARCLATSSPAAAAAACAEIAVTLEQGGVPDGGVRVMRAMDRSPDAADEYVPGAGWGHRLLAAGGPEAVAQTLDTLRAHDTDLARGALAVIEGRPAGRRRDEDGFSALDAAVRTAMFDGSGVAPRLLRAVERVAAGHGVAALDRARAQTRAWRVFSSEVQHEQSPFVLARSARDLAAVGVNVDSRDHEPWICKLRDHWLDHARGFSSPSAAADLVRTFATWDVDWGHQLSTRIDLDRVGRRLHAGSAGDLTGGVALAARLCAVAAEESAARVVEHVLAPDSADVEQLRRCRLLGMEGSARLVELAARLVPEAALRFAEVLAAEVERHVGARLRLDERAHWLALGQVMDALALTGVRLPSIGEPVRRPDLTYPAAVAYATARMPRVGWVLEEGGAARRRLLTAPAGTSTERALVLASTAQGWSDDVELRAAHRVGSLALASDRSLRALTVAAYGVSELGALLAEHADELRERCREPLRRGDWDARWLQYRLDAEQPAATNGVDRRDRSEVEAR